jgi:conjugal transfer pilus assembly protein TraV
MSDGRVPIRSPAQVLRIFFAPWEDDQGNLHFSGMVFSEVQPRRWEIGLPAEKESAVMKPLQTGLVTTSRPEEPERAPQAAAPNKGKHTSGPAAKQEQQ